MLADAPRVAASRDDERGTQSRPSRLVAAQNEIELAEPLRQKTVTRQTNEPLFRKRETRRFDHASIRLEVGEDLVRADRLSLPATEKQRILLVDRGQRVCIPSSRSHVPSSLNITQDILFEPIFHRLKPIVVSKQASDSTVIQYGLQMSAVPGSNASNPESVISSPPEKGCFFNLLFDERRRHRGNRGGSGVPYFGIRTSSCRRSRRPRKDWRRGYNISLFPKYGRTAPA